MGNKISIEQLRANLGNPVVLQFRVYTYMGDPEKFEFISEDLAQGRHPEIKFSFSDCKFTLDQIRPLLDSFDKTKEAIVMEEVFQDLYGLNFQASHLDKIYKVDI